MLRIYYLLIIMGLLTAAHCAQAAGSIAIGDSMTAQQKSWHSFLPHRYIQVHAQNGRTVRDFNLSDDLKANPSVDTVIYMLGGNDIMQAVDSTTFVDAARAHITFLKSRGFKVLIVVPPVLVMHPEDSARIRWILTALSYEQRVQMLDLENIWDVNQTSDTVHPLQSLSESIAQAIDGQL